MGTLSFKVKHFGFSRPASIRFNPKSRVSVPNTHLRCTPKLLSPHPQLQQPSMQPYRRGRALRDNPVVLRDIPVARRCIHVVLRCRPGHATMGNTPPENRIVWNALSGEVGVKTRGHEEEPQQWYKFDEVFGAFATQMEVYCRLAFPILDEVFSGCKCTVIAYGQTGTGKTHTMVGQQRQDAGFTWNEDSKAGLIPRFIHHIFERLSGADFSVNVSLLEIYNEKILDLLCEDVPEQLRHSQQPQHLQLYDDPQHGMAVRGLREVRVTSAIQAWRILRSGLARRKTARTPIHSRSSRSHAVLSVTVRIKEIEADGTGRTTAGTLNLVDLASSENFCHYPVPDQRAKEALNINQSLLVLGHVITALAQRRPHAPYRDSTLTRFLQDSLGGRAKTTIIATVPQLSGDLKRLQITLKYASEARNIINEPEVDQTVREWVPMERAAEEDSSDDTEDSSDTKNSSDQPEGETPMFALM